MSALRIALISPHAWPPRDDVAHHLRAEARALARRGHRVTVLAPAWRRADVAAGRAREREALADPDALLPPPGEVAEVAIGRAIPTGAGRRVGEPFDLAATLESVLSRTPFDVVHLHEPLAPSPALAALRHAAGVSAATFHRAEPLAGVAFLRPLIDRALARVDLRIATNDAARAALEQVLPGDYVLVPPGVDPAPGAAPADGPPGLVMIARGRDRVSVRFALEVLRAIDWPGPVTLIGPADAPWRTRAAVPKALRERVHVVPDEGPDARAQAIAGAAVALVSDPDDAAGPTVREAMAAGCAVLVPRRAAAAGAMEDGHDAVVLPPYTREAWIDALLVLRDDAAERARLGANARAHAEGRTWDAVAADLEALYIRAMRDAATNGGTPGERVRADLRVRGEGIHPDVIVDRCQGRDISVVAVVAEGLGPARAVTAVAPPGLRVIPGQEVTTTDGVLVGLYLRRPVKAGLTPADAAHAIHAQGGIVMAPHPELGAPSAATLRALGPAVDLREAFTAEHDAPPEAVAALTRAGLRPCATSAAGTAEDIGACVTELRPFEGPTDLLLALDDARLVRTAPETGARRGRRPTS